MAKHRQFQALGKRICELRRERKLTQGKLAERSNLTTNYIGKIERGEAQPTLEALLVISDALKTNPSTLFRYLDRPSPKEEIKKRIRELLELL